MYKIKYKILLFAVLLLVSSIVGACSHGSAPAPTSIPEPMPTPTPAPTVTPEPTPTPTPAKPPSAVREVHISRAETDDTSQVTITVNFKPPNSGAKPFEYFLRYKASEDSDFIDVSLSTAEWKETLNRESSYTLEIYATDENSQAGEKYTVSPASAPKNLKSEWTTAGNTLSLTWDAPEDNGNSEISEYVVEYRTASGKWESSDRERVIAPNRKVTLNESRSLKASKVRVAALTPVGLGSWAENNVPPSLNVSPIDYDFGNVRQDSTPSNKFTVTNAGGGTITWQVDNFTSDCFTVSPEPGSLQSGNGDITVTVKRNAKIGSCSDNVTVDAGDAGSKRITITVNVKGPELKVSPADYSFGTIIQGSTISKRFTVTNAGGGTITWQVDNFTSDCFTVSPEPGSSQSGNGMITVTVKRDAPDGSCTDSVIVNAGTAGIKTITLKANVGQPPKLAISPTDYDFGNVNQGSTPSTEFTVTNAGGGTLTWEVDNLASDCFTVSPSPGSSQSGNGMITVTVKSDAPDGSCSDSVIVNAGSTGTKSITVKASIGQPPVLDVSPTDYDFGNVNQGNTPSKEFTVTNAGGGTLTWQVDNLASDCFTVSPSPGSSQSGNGSLTVSLKSDAPDGSCSDSVIVNAGSTGTKSITVKASIGQPPVLDVSPTDYDFGNVNQGNTPSKEFTVTNAGGGTLTWQVDSNFTSDCFTVSPSPGSSQSGNGSLTVSLKSDAPDGSCTDSVIVNDGNAGTKSIRIKVNVEGPELDVSPSSHDFGNVNQGNTQSKEFTVTNAGGGTLTWEVADNFTSDCFTVSPSPGSSQSGNGIIIVTVKRDARIGSCSDSVIVDAGTAGTKSIRITVNVAEPPKLNVSLTDYDFGNIQQGDTPSKEFTVTNAGGGTITWQVDDLASDCFTASPSPGSSQSGNGMIIVTVKSDAPDGSCRDIVTVDAGTAGQENIKVMANIKIYRILFHSAHEIYTMNSDGTDVKRLTNNDAYDSPYAWSPDGSRILFISTRDGNTGDIYTMKADGTDVKRLTNNDEDDSPRAWSPDGSHILFESNRDGKSEVYTMRADGTDIKRLTNNDAYDYPVAWASDGNRILFTSTRDDDHREIYTMRADGTDVKRLTNNDADDSPYAWSPDGSRILFVSTRDGNSEIYTMRADGTDLKRLTNNDKSDVPFAWSPDGSRILFDSTRDGNFEIYTMKADGTDVKRLTNNDADDSPYAWSPDGSRILFRSDRDGNREIYTIKVDGTDVKRLTNNDAPDYPALPSPWSP